MNFRTITVILIAWVLVTSCVSLGLHEVREPGRRVFELINDFRASEGLPRLKYLKRRQWEVDLWARHISNRFEHARSGYTCENIAYNYENSKELFWQWKNSPGHRANMLLNSIRCCAVAVYTDGTRCFGVFRGYR